MKAISKLRIVVMASVILMQAPVVLAQNSVKQLEQLMSGFVNYTASFEQYTKDEKGRKGEVSKGIMSVQRPNKFRWETNQPFPQLIVSDGSYIWIYDPDLEQATRKKVQESETNGAALILNGDIDTLNKRFKINQLIDNDREKLFELVPKKESNFEKIQLFFAAKVMQELMLVDIFGKSTTIILTNPQLNTVVEPGLFKFTPPEGTDLMTDADS